MSQIIACKTDSGIVLAADSKALDFDPQGNLVELQINRLTQLTSHSAILAGGAATGESMCHALRDFLVHENLADIEDVYPAALPFLATEYERFMRQTCKLLPVDPIHHVHFILGGYSTKNLQKPFQLFLIWTKKKLPQLDGEDISSAFSVPRLISLEYRLAKLSREGQGLESILPEIRNSLEKQGRASEDIGGPYVCAFITRNGFERAAA